MSNRGAHGRPPVIPFDAPPSPYGPRGRAVYIAWDADGVPLYLGAARILIERFRHHRCSKPWWHRVARVDHDWFPTPWQACMAEQFWITRLCPIQNRQMPPWRPNGLTLEQQEQWLAAFNTPAAEALAELEDGADLEEVARSRHVHPRYLIRLGRQRSSRWAHAYTGEWDDLPRVAWDFGVLTALGENSAPDWVRRAERERLADVL